MSYIIIPSGTRSPESLNAKEIECIFNFILTLQLLTQSPTSCESMSIFIVIQPSRSVFVPSLTRNYFVFQFNDVCLITN